MDSLSESRLVSPSVAVGPGTAVAPRKLAGTVIPGSDLVSQLRRAAPDWAGEVQVELRDTRGQILSNDRPVSGVVLYVLTGRDFRRQGRMVVP
jgi:hypothetical protein